MLNEQSLVRAIKTLIVDKLADIVDLIVVGSTLEPATADTLGGVKIGAGVNVTEDGTISVNMPASGWTLVDTKGTSVPIPLPDTYDELLIMVGETSGGNRLTAVSIIPHDLTPTASKSFVFWVGSDSYKGKVTIATTGITLTEVKKDGASGGGNITVYKK